MNKICRAGAEELEPYQESRLRNTVWLLGFTIKGKLFLIGDRSKIEFFIFIPIFVPRFALLRSEYPCRRVYPAILLELTPPSP